MTRHYLLIASRDPFSHAAAQGCYQLATRLAGDGQRVTLFLVQNGVLPARGGPGSAALQDLARRGVRVAADELSLRERGIDPSRVAGGVEPASLDLVIDALAHGARALWH
jgi:sulfur relay (sulfurtransferase) complex TusBCD TusD component (DsrE family)